MKILGNIMRNGRVLERSVTVHIRFFGKRWGGEIQLPKGSKILRGSYDLALKNARKGRIAISVVTDDMAYFDGDGNLA